MNSLSAPGEPSVALGEDENLLRLLAEQVVVEKRPVTGDTVRVATVTNLREQEVAEPLTREHIEIERVVIDRIIEEAPSIRQEGDVTILPVVEEVLVLERRLVLKEEVRIRRVQVTEMHRETVSLREQSVLVTRSRPE